MCEFVHNFIEMGVGWGPGLHDKTNKLLERNAIQRIFEDLASDEAVIWSKIKFAASLWAFSSKQFGELSILDIKINWAAAMY